MKIIVTAIFGIFCSAYFILDSQTLCWAFATCNSTSAEEPATGVGFGIASSIDGAEEGAAYNAWSKACETAKELAIAELPSCSAAKGNGPWCVESGEPIANCDEIPEDLPTDNCITANRLDKDLWMKFCIEDAIDTGRSKSAAKENCETFYLEETYGSSTIAKCSVDATATALQFCKTASADSDEVSPVLPNDILHSDDFDPYPYEDGAASEEPVDPNAQYDPASDQYDPNAAHPNQEDDVEQRFEEQTDEFGLE